MKARRELSDLKDLLLDVLDAGPEPILRSTTELAAQVPPALLTKPQAAYKALMHLTFLGYIRPHHDPGQRALQWTVAVHPKIRERELLARIHTEEHQAAHAAHQDHALPIGA